MAQQKMLLGHVKGDKGDKGADGKNGTNGKDAVIVSGTVAIEGDVGVPSGTVTMGGEPGAQTISITLTNIKGEPGTPGEDGAAGPAGPAGPPGENATTTALASQDAPGLLRALSGQEDQVLLGNGEWGEYHGGGGGGSGPMAFEVRSDGHLWCIYDDGLGEPDLYVNDQGHLMWRYETQE